MLERFSQVESWFVERGYECDWKQDVDSWLLSCVLQQGGLSFRLYFAFYEERDGCVLTRDGCVLTSIGYSVQILSLEDFEAALMEWSCFTWVAKHDYGRAKVALPRRYIPGRSGLWWCWEDVWLELDGVGERWERLLESLDDDLPVVWSALADAEDLCAAVDESPYWSWYREG